MPIFSVNFLKSVNWEMKDAQKAIQLSTGGMLDVGCLMFDVGCLMFDVGCLMFDV